MTPPRNSRGGVFHFIALSAGVPCSPRPPPAAASASASLRRRGRILPSFRNPHPPPVDGQSPLLEQPDRLRECDLLLVEYPCRQRLGRVVVADFARSLQNDWTGVVR